MVAAFVELETRLCEATKLACPIFDAPVIVETDASSFAVGAILYLKGESRKVHPIQFACRTLNTAKKTIRLVKEKQLQGYSH